MLNQIEFYNSPSGSVQFVRNGKQQVLTESRSDVIEDILQLIHECFADAYLALEDCYKKSVPNKRYHHFLMVNRFIRCNCGEYDTLRMDIDEHGNINLEQVHCPLRGTGDCKYEGIICMPVRTSVIKGRQLKIAELLADGYSNQEIADLLYISIHTVHNMIQQMKFKLKVDNTREIASWYNRTYSHV